MREVRLTTESWEMTTPFRITGHVFTGAHVLVVGLTEEGCTGQGDAAGVYYLGESAGSMLAQAESVRRELEQGADRCGRERSRAQSFELGFQRCVLPLQRRKLRIISGRIRR